MSQAVIEIDTSEWDEFLSKMVSNLKRAQAHLKVAAQAFAFQDIDSHFREEEGPGGKWAPRTPETQRRYSMIASGQWRPPKGARAGSFQPSNKLLQLTGHMRQSTLPQNIEDVGSDSIRVFNNAVYSLRHDQGGGGIPARPFMWLSDKTQDKMANTVLQLITEDAEGSV